MTTVFIIVGCAAALVGSSFLFYHLGKKGVDAGKALSTANNAVNMLDTAFDTVKPFIPASPAVSIVGKIIDWAQSGTAAAEQLYKTSKIQGDERKAEAIDFVMNALKIAGITITPEIAKMIDGAVEASVKLLPKTNGSTAVYNQTVNLAKDVTPSEVAKQIKEATSKLISQSDSAASTEAQNSASTEAPETTVKTVTDDAGKVVSQTACAADTVQESGQDATAAQENEIVPAAAQAAADLQTSNDALAASSTAPVDAISAAAKVLTAGAILLNNAVSAMAGSSTTAAPATTGADTAMPDATAASGSSAASPATPAQA